MTGWAFAFRLQNFKLAFLSNRLDRATLFLGILYLRIVPARLIFEAHFQTLARPHLLLRSWFIAALRRLLLAGSLEIRTYM